jgi:hypothetical protein
LVGVTAGLGVPRTLTWNGSKRTAPETPAGLANEATRRDATNATGKTEMPWSTTRNYRAIFVARYDHICKSPNLRTCDDVPRGRSPFWNVGVDR